MEFLPRVCDPSLLSRLPGTQFPVSMIHSGYSTCNFVQTFGLSHLNRVLSCEVDHNLVRHTTRHTPILVFIEVQKLQYQLKPIARITKEKFGVSVDHDLLLFSQYVSYAWLFFTYTHG